MRRPVAIGLFAILTACAGKEPPPDGAGTEANKNLSAGAEQPSVGEAAEEQVVADLAPPLEEVEPESAVELDPITGLPPFTEEQRAIFLASPEDDPVEEEDLRGVTSERFGRHYVAGNERSLFAFRDAISGLGGGYVGVGSDQAYVLIGWAEPELVWLIDYDARVNWVHDIYGAFFRAAETPEDFLALWQKDNKKQGQAVLEAAYEGKQLKRATWLYKHHRGWIARRLNFVAKRHRQVGVPVFLTDSDMYAKVRQRVISGRLRIMTANLFEKKGIKGIGDTARQLNVPIRLVYLSNAEEYWNRYPRNFRQNMAALPYDDRSLVIRTLLTWSRNEDYRYVAQPALNFVEWLEKPYTKNVYFVARRKKHRPVKGVEWPEPYFYVVDDHPEDTERAKKWAEAHGDDGGTGGEVDESDLPLE